MTENDIQRAIVEYLEAVLCPSYRAFAIPNASRRTKGGKAANAVPGLRPGVPDLGIAGEGRIFFLEVKRDQKASLSDAQHEWANWCLLGRTPWARVESIDHVRAALHHWGIETREAA